MIATSCCPASPQRQPRRPVNPPPNRLDFEPVTTTKPKGVVYMLHGWAQNVHVFSNRARKLTKRLNKAGYKVVFLQGPHRLPPVEGTLTVNADQHNNEYESAKDNTVFSREYAYAWFFYGDAGSSEPAVLEPSPEGDFRGMDISLSFLQSELKADRVKFLETNHDGGPPPSFLLGFSQGAVLVHKVATLACERSDVTENHNAFEAIQKCVLVSGFSFTAWIQREDDANNDTRRTRTTIMPSLHVVGNKDSRVSPHLTMDLYNLEPCFGGGEQGENTKILWEHDRGHVLPQDLKFCNRLLEFLATT